MSGIPGSGATGSAVDRDRTPPDDRKIPAEDEHKGLFTSDSNPSVPTVETRSTSPEAVWRKLPGKEKYNYAWTKEELHVALKEDHSWLNPDPAVAEVWKRKLLEYENPIRSLAMFKKWRLWMETGAYKRPRSGVMRGRVEVERVVKKRNLRTTKPTWPRGRGTRMESATSLPGI